MSLQRELFFSRLPFLNMCSNVIRPEFINMLTLERLIFSIHLFYIIPLPFLVPRGLWTKCVTPYIYNFAYMVPTLQIFMSRCSGPVLSPAPTEYIHYFLISRHRSHSVVEDSRKSSQSNAIYRILKDLKFPGNRKFVL